MSKITGLKQLHKNLKKEFAAIEKNTQRGLLKAAHRVVARSKELTPVDTGSLRSNQFASPTEKGAKIEVKQNYAIYVHEDLAAHHPTGQAKFLETALNENKDAIFRAAAGEDE